NAATAMVSRNTDPSVPLTVALASSVPSRVSVPATVTIAAGQTTANFHIGAIDNGLADGDQTVALSASQHGFTTGTATVTINDDDGPTLTLAISPTTLSEGAGAAAATGTITRNTDPSQPLPVSINSSDPARATVPNAITIPAGA